MNKMAYFKNVLNFDKSNTTVLILDEDISLDEVELRELKRRQTIKFLWMAGVYDFDAHNVFVVKRDLNPRSLKNINYCLYRGGDIEIKQALLFSGITIVHSLKDIDYDIPQTSLDRINNFELGNSIA